MSKSPTKNENPFAGLNTVELLAHGLLMAVKLKGSQRADVVHVCAHLAHRMTEEERSRAIRIAGDAMEGALVLALSTCQKGGEA